MPRCSVKLRRESWKVPAHVQDAMRTVGAARQRQIGLEDREDMHSTVIRWSCAAALAVAAGAAMAQESDNRVGANTDWSVFEETEPRQCWAVSSPKEVVNTRDGRVVAARRGEILLFVSFIPEDGVEGQVSFTGGYPFASGSTVTIQVGDDTFELFTDGDVDAEWAWSASDGDDAAIIAAMKRGAEAVLTGLSSRGTSTKDTFSLIGFTASVDEASARCNG